MSSHSRDSARRCSEVSSDASHRPHHEESDSGSRVSLVSPSSTRRRSSLGETSGDRSSRGPMFQPRQSHPEDIPLLHPLAQPKQVADDSAAVGFSVFQRRQQPHESLSVEQLVQGLSSLTHEASAVGSTPITHDSSIHNRIAIPKRSERIPMPLVRAPARRRSYQHELGAGQEDSAVTTCHIPAGSTRGSDTVASRGIVSSPEGLIPKPRLSSPFVAATAPAAGVDIASSAVQQRRRAGIPADSTISLQPTLTFSDGDAVAPRSRVPVLYPGPCGSLLMHPPVAAGRGIGLSRSLDLGAGESGGSATPSDERNLFNYAQFVSRSSQVLDTSKRSSQYISQYLKMNPHSLCDMQNHSFQDLLEAAESSRASAIEQRPVSVDFSHVSSPETLEGIPEAAEPPYSPRIHEKEQAAAARRPQVQGRSKVLWYEDRGGREFPSASSVSGTKPSPIGETTELPPRIEAFELPCYFSDRPQKILMILRIWSDDVAALATALAQWLQTEWAVSIFVEREAVESMERFGATNLLLWDGDDGDGKFTEKGEDPSLTESGDRSDDPGLEGTIGDESEMPQIDFVISIGGDGTTLLVSTIFPDVVPPVVSLSMGSLAYLNQFRPDEAMNILRRILTCEVFSVQLRARLVVQVLDEDRKPILVSHVVNEAVVDRGPCSSLIQADVYVNDQFFTTVAADGLILATPSGSTAYSMSAGGAMVHPNVPCILFTPICPHTLSMRPLVLPDSAVVGLQNPPDSRSSLWLSLDGRVRQEVKRGQAVVVAISPFPFPLVCKSSSENGDSWMAALKSNLNWNMRIRQKPHAPPTELPSPGQKLLPPAYVKTLPADLRHWLHSKDGRQRQVSSASARDGKQLDCGESSYRDSPAASPSEFDLSVPEIHAPTVSLAGDQTPDQDGSTSPRQRQINETQRLSLERTAELASSVANSNHSSDSGAGKAESVTEDGTFSKKYSAVALARETVPGVQAISPQTLWLASECGGAAIAASEMREDGVLGATVPRPHRDSSTGRAAVRPTSIGSESPGSVQFGVPSPPFTQQGDSVLMSSGSSEPRLDQGRQNMAHRHHGDSFRCPGSASGEVTSHVATSGCITLVERSRCNVHGTDAFSKLLTGCGNCCRNQPLVASAANVAAPTSNLSSNGGSHRAATATSPGGPGSDLRARYGSITTADGSTAASGSGGGSSITCGCGDLPTTAAVSASRRQSAGDRQHSVRSLTSSACCTAASNPTRRSPFVQAQGKLQPAIAITPAPGASSRSSGNGRRSKGGDLMSVGSHGDIAGAAAIHGNGVRSTDSETNNLPTSLPIKSSRPAQETVSNPESASSSLLQSNTPTGGDL